MPSPHPRPIQPDGRLHGVIVGCRRDDGRWLLIRRSRHVAAPLQIGFPGGAIELGEAHTDAAVREFREELGADVTVLRHAWRREAEDRPLTLFGYLARLESARLAPNADEVAEVLWLNPAEIAVQPDTLPGCEDFAAALEVAWAADPHA